MDAKLQKWTDRLPDLGHVMKRFPVAVAIMGCVTLFLIFKGVDGLRQATGFMLIGAALAAYIAMMQTLWAEARRRKPSWILQIIIAAALTALFYHAKPLHLNIGMLIGAVLLILGNSVRFGLGRDDLHIWDFTHKIWTAAGFATLGSMIYMLGVFAIMAALKSLFGVNIDQFAEHFIMPVGLVFLAPLYWLSNVPPVDEPYDYLTDTPSFVAKAVAFLGTWILSPLTLIYALILLAYAFKIIFQMELPKGEIAQLTTPFLLIGTLTWLLLEPPFIQKTALARLFRKFWFILSVPAAVMLAISVSVRVAEYGLTVQRILLILVYVWSLVLAAWFIFAPKLRRDIRIIPALAAVLLVAAAPSAHYLSNASQTSRFETNLRAAGILQMDGAVKATDLSNASAADKTAARKAKGALHYLTTHDGQGHIEDVLRNSDVKVDTDLKRYKLKEAYVQALGLENVKENFGVKSPITRRDIGYQSDVKSVSVQGFDRFHGQYWMSTRGNNTLISDKAFTLRYDGSDLVISQGKQVLYRYGIESWFENLNIDDNVLRVKSPYLRIVDTDTHKVELIFIDINRDEFNGSHSFSANFYVLTSGFK